MKFRVDLKSDTVTLPPEPMRDAIRNAELGDDFYFEDPTVLHLECKAARLLGKEAAMLVLSGTMGNLVSVMSQAIPGSECIVEQDAHMFRSEAGGIARIAGMVPRRLPSKMGVMEPDVIERQITKRTVLNGGTAMISVEQTHNGAGGTLIPLDNLRVIREIADKYGITVHMDGARVFNAAIGLGVPVKDVVKDVDSVTFCLSKGLCCPLGAVVAGSKELVQKGRFHRQVLGGGMRQAGIIAAAGIWALDNMVERLTEDHECAKRLASLAVDAGFGINRESVQSNIVRVDTSPLTAEHFRHAMNVHGIDVLVVGPATVRCVTHWPVTSKEIDEVGSVMRDLKKESPMQLTRHHEG